MRGDPLSDAEALHLPMPRGNDASMKVILCTDSAVQRNDFELIPTVRMESQHSIGAPTCHDFPRYVIISEKSRLEVESR